MIHKHRWQLVIWRMDGWDHRKNILGNWRIPARQCERCGLTQVDLGFWHTVMEGIPPARVIAEQKR